MTLAETPTSSPFRAKGVLYQGIAAYAEANIDGGVASVIASLPEGLRAFFAQGFLASQWYDLAPFVHYSTAAARCARVPYADVLRRMAVAQAERDTSGVYRVLLALATPDLVMSRLPRTAQTYFDFVRSSVSKTGPQAWAIALEGIPAFAAATYVTCSAAFIETALARSGAKEPHVTSERPVAAGAERGHPVVTIRRTVRWT